MAEDLFDILFDIPNVRLYTAKVRLYALNIRLHMANIGSYLSNKYAYLKRKSKKIRKNHSKPAVKKLYISRAVAKYLKEKEVDEPKQETPKKNINKNAEQAVYPFHKINLQMR